jgi:hypothetical protein
MEQKGLAASVPSGTAFSGLMGILKIPLFFAPFVFLHGCAEGQYPSYTIFYFMALPVLWPFVLVTLVVLIAIILFALRQRSIGFVQRTKFGLTMSTFSFLGLAWTGWWLKNGSDGDLLWGFWALLACDIGMIGGYAHDLARLPNLQITPNESFDQITLSPVHHSK